MQENETRVITPENVEYSYELAGIGSRIMAMMYDVMLQLLISLVFVGLFLLLTVVSTVNETFTKMGGWAGIITISLLILLFFAVFWGYFIFFDMIWQGQSPGKRYMKIRVIKDGGYPLDLYASLIRNLLRIVDILPSIYAVGTLTVFLSKTNKRIGDYAAGTIVVKEDFIAAPKIIEDTRPIFGSAFLPIKNLDRITEEDYGILRQFLERRFEIESDEARKKIAGTIASRLLEKLELSANPYPSAEEFIMNLVFQYRERRGNS